MKYLAALLITVSAFAQNAQLTPVPKLQFSDALGVPLNGGKVCSYLAGTSTPSVTYTNSTGGTPNANPLILDSGGYGAVWLGNRAYRIVLHARGTDTTCNTGTVIFDIDQVRDLGLELFKMLGQPNGIATLDSNGKVPASQISITTPITSQIIGGERYADQYPGANIGIKINNAFADCGLNPVSCTVKLSPNNTYSYSTTIVIPGGRSYLDCSGAILNYTGSTDGILVSPGGTTPPYVTGEISNCFVQNGNLALPMNMNGIHMQSRIGFKYTNIGISGFNTTGSAGMWWENTSVMPQFSEQNAVVKYDSFDNKRAIKLTNSSGTNSFLYNYYSDVHCTLSDAQFCLSMEGDGTPNNVLVFGGYMDIRANINAATLSAHVIHLQQGAVLERLSVNITGEVTSGAATNYAMYVADTVSGGISVTGNVNVTGAGGFSAGAQGSLLVLPPINLLTNSVHWEPGGGILNQRHCKFDWGYPNTNVLYSGNAINWLASYNGTENNCFFQIIARNTDNSNPDVNIQGGGAAPVNIMYTDALSKMVGIGPGFSTGAPPTAPLEVNGQIYARADIKQFGHLNSVSANTDQSFQTIIPAGMTTSPIHTFSPAYASTPNCPISANLPIERTITIMAVDYLTYTAPFIVVTPTQIQVQITNAQGSDVTIFITCRGNPN